MVLECNMLEMKVVKYKTDLILVNLYIERKNHNNTCRAALLN
jgi:hypothetical protein